jgi:hypothetical protein
MLPRKKTATEMEHFAFDLEIAEQIKNVRALSL